MCRSTGGRKWILTGGSRLVAGQKAGTTDRVLEVGKAKREYVLYIPRSYKRSKKKAVPLVLMLHGRTSNARRAATASTVGRAWQLAEKDGFIAVFPRALGTPTSWKAGRSGRATKDSEFLAAMIDALIAEFRIDEHRVYMTGHSSSAFMSFSFASTHPENIAAIGPVAGLVIGGGSKPKMPVFVISFHGMADRVVAYDSVNGKKAKRGRGLTSAPDSPAIFARQNACVKKPVREDILKGRVHIDTWAGGKRVTRVELCSIEEGNHGWLQASRKWLGATQLIWKSFQEHGREPPKSKSKTSRTRQKSGSKG